MREERRAGPEAEEHREDSPLRHLPRVSKRIGDCDVSIEADAAEMEEGCGRKENIVGVKDVTDDPSEPPEAEDLLEGAEGHNEEGDEKVGQGQGHYEPIGDYAKALEPEDADDDEDVTGSGEEDDRREKDDLQ